jgi:signal transduction histidine kinase
MMFRVNRSADSRIVVWATFVLAAVLFVATGVTAWLVVEIRKAQQAITEIIAGGVVEDIERLGSLPSEIRWQLLCTVLVLIVLIVTGAALVVIGRAYLNSLSSIRKIKVLASDILASIDQGVITADGLGNITSINPRGQQLLDVTFDCVGHPLAELGEHGQPLSEASKEVMETGKGQFDRFLAVTHNGHSSQLRIECHVLRETDNRTLGTVLLIRDVTERLLIEERMRRMERFMGLGTLAAGLHHEIKNPLSALALHVQLLEERMEDHVDQETAETMGVLKTEVTRIAGVLESFRDYASIERLNRTDTDLSGLVNQTLELIRPQAQQQQVSLVVDQSAGRPLVVSLDATRFEQVLLNLVMNGLEAMPDGGTLTLAVDSSEGTVTVSVADTGSGIPESVQKRILDPYFTTKNEGSGMGLAVCDKIVRQHGGQIKFETGSSGTTFLVSLPVENH